MMELLSHPALAHLVAKLGHPHAFPCPDGVTRNVYDSERVEAVLAEVAGIGARPNADPDLRAASGTARTILVELRAGAFDVPTDAGSRPARASSRAVN